MQNKNTSRWLWLLPLIPVFGSLLLEVFGAGPQEILRNNLFDQYQRWKPRTYSEAPVNIIDIDEESLTRVGQWPWPRSRMAELVDRLTQSGVASIGFDVMFAEPDRTSPKAAADLWQLTGKFRADLTALPDHDEILAKSLKRADAVLGFAVERNQKAPHSDSPLKLPVKKANFITLGESQTRWLHPFTSAVPSLLPLETAAKGNGALTFVPDSDGVVRRVPLVLQLADDTIGTLTSESLRVAQGTAVITLRSAGHINHFTGDNDNGGLGEIRIGEITVPTTANGEMWVHYTRHRPERSIPAWKILAGEIPREEIEGKILLIGSSAQGLMDLRFNPFGLMAGVEAHAQALEQMLTGQFLERPSWARGAETAVMVIGGLLIGLIALRAQAILGAALCTLFVGATMGAGWYAYAEYGLLLDVALPSIGIALTFTLCSLAHHLSSEREHRWVKEAFSRYVSPNRVEHLLDNPEAMALGGRRQECSFIFTDLAGFTSLMEKIDPGEAVALLNDYLDEMIAIAFKHEGTLDRIVGDAVAIMFSAPVSQPDHRARALACALEMDAFASQFSKTQQEKGIAFGKTRIGIHAGEVIVGNFGGKNIFDYRALGDPINTAARLESVNKHLGTRMCVSENIMADCPDARVRPVGRLVLKGKSVPLGVFEPISPDLEILQAPLADYQAAYAAMHEESTDAAERFAQLKAAYPDDPLVNLHHQRLQAGEKGDLIVMADK
jgi:adenylate cyclase